jgi:SAM-dependent methyltransferase
LRVSTAFWRPRLKRTAPLPLYSTVPLPSLGLARAIAGEESVGSTELSHRLRAGPSHVWQLLNDWWLNIDTMHDPGASPEAFLHDGVSDYRGHYQGANYLYLQQIARLLTLHARHRLVFYDIGCGKGRPLCVMARHPFAKVVGVELRGDLCDAARENARNLRGRVAPIEIVQGDACSVDLRAGDVYFFFNPFGAPTLERVLDAIEQSLTPAPRDVTLVYYNALHEHVFQACSWLENYHVLPTHSGVHVSFWRNRRAQS